MKILFTSAGRRVELVQEFHKAAREVNCDLIIFGTDITETAPALYFCDKYEIVCSIKDSNYIPQLIDLCEKEKIDCLIPTIDTDLLILSENKEKFERIGTKVLISDKSKIEICRNKVKTYEYFIGLGLDTPFSIDTIENFNLDFPVFIKPKDGSSSINAYRVDSYEDLVAYANKINDFIIQPYLEGREYTVDIFCDYKGNPVYITPRERVAVRSGEVLKTKIHQDNKIINDMLRLIRDFKPCGQITVQLIRNNFDGKDYYIEINPRFGGGAPLSIKAGANSACAVLKMLNGEELKYCNKAAEDGLIYSRFDQSICVNNGKESERE